MSKAIHFRQTSTSDQNFLSLMDEISSDLDDKIDRLQQRRWRKLRDEMA